jgi:hypothetical protein
VNVFCLGADEIDKHWHDFRPHLERFERLGEINVDEARDQLRAGLKQLWGCQSDQRIVGVCLTRVAGTTCEVCGAVGSASKDEILTVYREIEAWAASLGCTRMRVTGRRGWQRVLKGFEQTGVILEKDLWADQAAAAVRQLA